MLGVVKLCKEYKKALNDLVQEDSVKEYLSMMSYARDKIQMILRGTEYDKAPDYAKASIYYDLYEHGSSAKYERLLDHYKNAEKPVLQKFTEMDSLLNKKTNEVQCYRILVDFNVNNYPKRRIYFVNLDFNKTIFETGLDEQSQDAKQVYETLQYYKRDSILFEGYKCEFAHEEK